MTLKNNSLERMSRLSQQSGGPRAVRGPSEPNSPLEKLPAQVQNSITQRLNLPVDKSLQKPLTSVSPLALKPF